MQGNENNKLFTKNLLYKMLINLAETTFTNNVIRNLSFIITKRVFGLILNTLFLKDDQAFASFQLTSKIDAYTSLTWELSKRHQVIFQQTGFNVYKNDFVQFPTQKFTLKLDFTDDSNKLQMISVQIKEELEEGLKETDSDPYKALFHNFHIVPYNLTHFDQIDHLRDRLMKEVS